MARAYTVIPYQLSDEAYANLLRNPEQCGFRVLQPGAVRDPQFGYLFLESRRHEARRPRLLDGLDWVPSSAANASSRVLHDGVTELVRNYCARRTKSEAARPQIRPFVEFQRSVNDEVKQQYPQASALDHKTIVGRMWRAMPSAEKEAYKAQAAAKNRNARQRMAAAQPQELLVRHEMWLQLSDLWTASDPAFDGACSERLLLHYLGDDAWHCLSCPPDAIGIVTEPWVPSTPSPWRSIGSGMRTTGPQAPQLVLSYSDQGEARPAPQVVHAIPLVAGQQAEPGAPTVPSFARLHQLGPSTSPALTVAASCEDADLAAHFGSGASFGGTGASFGAGAGGSAIDYGIAGASFGSPASSGGLAGLSAAGSFGTTALDQFLFQVQSGDPFHDDDGFSPLQSLATSVPLPNRPTGRFGAAHDVDEAEDLLLLTRLVQEEPIMRSLPPAKTARRAIGGRELPLSDSPNVMRAAALLAGVEPSLLTIPQVGASPMSVPAEAGPSRDQATSPIRMEETEPDADLPDFFTGAPADRRAAPAADAESEQACRASEGGEDSAAAHPTTPTSGFTFEELYTAML